ncbi:MAG: UDP-N-acetylglucosamine 1-carboxyvinyltransferase [Pseudomonadota bacterium]|nr:UDP-N-acetylglucosamine 1-carboxyvinyltransferase [Pseudomonadota bacterium]MEC7960914.1 UDP-N-acetylglucosamine 1-carboxyvinyltransferase [Pseudomonadota bacterium]
MDLIQVKGGNFLEGEINISGSKNASLPMIIASLLTKDKVKIKNIPNLSDVSTLLELIKTLGSEFELKNENNSSYKLIIQTKEIKNNLASYDLVRKMRASFWVLAPLILRYGEAKVSLPGGCAIGIRPINFYLSILEKMGASITIKDGYVQASLKNNLKPINYKLNFPSVGVTHFFLMMSSLVEGESILRNAAMEPEVISLAKMLNKMGAHITGYGTNKIIVTGCSYLKGIDIISPPDRIEAGTYALALAATGGKLKLNSIGIKEIETLRYVLENTNVDIKSYKNSIELIKKNRIIQPADIETKPYPGFPTDLQAQFMALMACSKGRSRIKETIFENRFMHVQELVRLGAKIELQSDTAIVNGVRKLYGAPLMATDLRASASLIIAALRAEGTSTIRRVYHLDRGFDKIEEKLKSCGAAIERKRDKNE